jgi:recombinational DNA repair protein RecT
MPEPKITKEMQAIVAIEQKRGNMETVIEQQKDKLLRNACGYVRSMTPDNQSAFFARTINALLDDNLSGCFNTAAGKLSIYRIIEETMATGLELGRHAYAVPQSGKARYDINRKGYHALLCGGDNPIFNDLRWCVVYENDKCSIDMGTGKVSHEVAIGKAQGNPIGVWVAADIRMTGDKTKTEARFFSMEFILNIKENHSNSTAWNTDPIPMYEKTAIKAFCRPWADVKDALAHAIYEEPGNGFPTEQQEIPREQQFEKILDATLAEDAPTETLGGEQKETDASNGQQPEKEPEKGKGENSLDDTDGLF